MYDCRLAALPMTGFSTLLLGAACLEGPRVVAGELAGRRANGLCGQTSPRTTWKDCRHTLLTQSVLTLLLRTLLLLFTMPRWPSPALPPCLPLRCGLPSSSSAPRSKPQRDAGQKRSYELRATCTLHYASLVVVRLVPVLE